MRMTYLFLLCPRPKMALVLQIISWIWGFAWLLTDWQKPKAAIEDEASENQWAFGQLYGVLLVGVPALSLLEIWAGKTMT